MGAALELPLICFGGNRVTKLVPLSGTSARGHWLFGLSWTILSHVEGARGYSVVDGMLLTERIGKPSLASTALTAPVCKCSPCLHLSKLKIEAKEINYRGGNDGLTE